MRAVAWVLVVIASFVPSLCLASPQGSEEIISGTLALSRAGSQTGLESFRLFKTETGYILTSTGRLSYTRGETDWRATLWLSPEFAPRRYELTRGGPGGDLALEAVWKEEEPYQVGIVSHLNGEEDTFSFSGNNWIVLDRDVISHYLALALVLHLSGPREFTAIAPQVPAAVPLAADEFGLAAFHAPWGEEVAQRWRLSLGGEEVLIYEHAGELLWAEVPGAGLSAWRSDLFPKLPSPYRIQKEEALPPGAREEDVQFPSGEVELAGTLLLPAGKGPFPAVLFVPGTGEINRDGSAPGKPAAIFRKLAYSLAEVGFASLRYDKRGVGGSSGDLSLASMSDLLSDARAALNWLVSLPEVDGVFVAGHSEGALHALALTGEGAQGLVLLGAPAEPLGDVLMWQLGAMLRSAGVPEKEVASELAKLAEFLTFARASHGDWSDYTPEDLRAALPSYSKEELEGMRRTSLRWWREALALDPLAEVQEVEMPVLVINGGADIRVPPEDAHLLAEAARAAGNPNAQGIVVPDMNHWLRFQPGRPVPEAVTGPLDPRAVQLLLDWLSARRW